MVTPYIAFNGNCKDALRFYQKVFEAEIKAMQQYGEYIPDGLESPPENLSDWIMHAEMQICGTNFWFADETEGVKPGNMIRLTATVPDIKAAQACFHMLRENGSVTLPPTETFYSTFHAALTDQYGICWNIVAEEAPKQR